MVGPEKRDEPDEGVPYADEEVDLEALAEEVYALLQEYLLLEQERGVG